MQKTSRKLLILALLIGTVVGGCTLIAEVDRSDIPDGEGGAGGETSE